MDTPKHKNDYRLIRRGRPSFLDDLHTTSASSDTGDLARVVPVAVNSATRFAPAPNGLVVVMSADSTCTFERSACRVSVGNDGRAYFIANEQVQIGPLSPESYSILRNHVGIPFVEKSVLTDAVDYVSVSV